MSPPLASSLPEIGRKRTETSTSPNFWSSSSATAHGWVSAVWARTWRPPEARRTHWPATNFHFGFSSPRSYFTDVLSSAAVANVAIASSSAATMIFMDPPVLRDSVQRLAHDLPVVSAHQGHLGHRSAILKVGCRDDGAIPRIGFDHVGRHLGKRPRGSVHGFLLGPSCREITVVCDRYGFEHHPGAVIHDHFHERLTRRRPVLRRIDRQLECAVVYLVLRRQRSPLTRTHDQAALERQPRTRHRPCQALSALARVRSCERQAYTRRQQTRYDNRRDPDPLSHAAPPRKRDSGCSLWMMVTSPAPRH